MLRVFTGQPEPAAEDFTKAIELDPLAAFAYYERGILKARKADFQGAIADYNNTLALIPNCVPALNRRGIAKNHLGLKDEAFADFDKAIWLNRRFYPAYENRGNLWVDRITPQRSTILAK